MQMRLAAACLLALSAALLSVGCAAGEVSRPGADGNFSLDEARDFADFPLYAPGESYGNLPLTAVNRAFDKSPEAPPVRSNYVDFIYGSCDASEHGCAPPLSVQVWAACERNPGVYSPALEREGPVEVRGVPAYFYEGGRRLELSTGTSTVVIFASDGQAALSAAAALEGVNNDLSRESDLPAPAYEREDGGVVSVIPCAYEDPTQVVEQDDAKSAAVAAALEDALSSGAKRGDNKGVRSVECFRSGALEPVAAIDDYHTCAIEWADGTGSTWCVFSSGENLNASSLPMSCEDAGGGSLLEPAEPPPGEAVVGDAELAWGAHANVACGPWRDLEMQAMAAFDPDVLYEDLSYTWFVLRPFEAGIVRDLRVIPGRKGAAHRAVALYERRLALVDSGLSAWQQGKKERALGRFDRAQALSLPLGQLFSQLHADTCSPP